jgi:hypothetical protein
MDRFRIGRSLVLRLTVRVVASVIRPLSARHASGQQIPCLYMEAEDLLARGNVLRVDQGRERRGQRSRRLCKKISRMALTAREPHSIIRLPLDDGREESRASERMIFKN